MVTITKEEFHAYLQVQYSGVTNMYDAQRVASEAALGYGVTLTSVDIANITTNYSQLKEKYGDLPTAKCDECGKVDHTVYERACGYQDDVNGISDSMETICDDCEHEHLMDI